MTTSIWHSIAHVYRDLGWESIIKGGIMFVGLMIFVSIICGTFMSGSSHSDNSNSTSSSSSSNDHTIKFEVTGIPGPLNASSLVSVHLECIKYCMDHDNNYNANRPPCYAACAELGKEGCNGKIS